MKAIITAGLLLISAIGIKDLQAQTNATPKVKAEQIEQQKRIHHGAVTGELTRKEAARLEMQQSKIRHDKHAAKADGVVTPAEVQD